MSESKRELALITVEDLAKYFLARADHETNPMFAQWTAEIAFSMNRVLDENEVLRVPTKGTIER